jgi:hypothetical protein
MAELGNGGSGGDDRERRVGEQEGTKGEAERRTRAFLLCTGRLLHPLRATYKTAEVGELRPTALATSMGTTERRVRCAVGGRLEHAGRKGKATEKATVPKLPPPPTDVDSKSAAKRGGEGRGGGETI